MERGITARHTGMHPIVSANPALNLEPEPGVEPRSNAYKAIVIAIILFRQKRVFTASHAPTFTGHVGSHFTRDLCLVCCRGYAPRSTGLQPVAFTRLAYSTLESLSGVEPESVL